LALLGASPSTASEVEMTTAKDAGFTDTAYTGIR
jgi:hypothetical protein